MGAYARASIEAMVVMALLLVALFVAPGFASAQGGINLSWDDCGTFGTELKFFACDTNAGVSVLYVSAIPGVPLPQMNGVGIVIDIRTSQPALSDWWQMGTGGCRALGITGQYNFAAGPFNCYDIWAGNAAGGLNYAAGFGAPNRARLRAVAAIPGSAAADEATEMYLFAFHLSNRKSTGAGSCAGCTDKACIVLNSVQLTQPAGVGDYTITNPINRQSVSWRCLSSISGHTGECTSFCTTPTRNPSWGSIKSHYR
ncbi:MAG: hypothetical protein ABIS67_10580 [Candidatus Eisenbacteria bacterium]